MNFQNPFMAGQLRLVKTVELLVLDTPTDSQGNAELDAWYGQRVASGVRGPMIRLWRSGYKDGISLSRKDVAHERGHEAMKAVRARGLDVVVRQTGGTAVPQGEGVFHVSWILPRVRDAVTTDAYFRVLCYPLLAWLEHLGVEGSHTGELAGSYCDGTYNILVGQHKLAGTAQAWRGGLAGAKSQHPGYVLAHACITVDVDFLAVSNWMNTFYEQSDNPYRIHPDTSVTLKALQPAMFDGANRREANKIAMESLRQFLLTWLPKYEISVLG